MSECPPLVVRAAEECAAAGLDAQRRTARGALQPYLRHPAVSLPALQAAVSFVPRPTDIIIDTYTKCGTTWLQQICHQLRTGGDMSFDEITAVAPWLDFALDSGVDLDADQVASPRLWKSHQRLSAINGGAKYIVTLRDPASVATSYFYFYLAKGLTRDVGLDEWAVRWGEPGSGDLVWCDTIWSYITDIYARRDDDRVLIVCFEDMKKRPLDLILRIAAFIGVQCDGELAQKVLSLSSQSFMAEHARQFDDHWLECQQLSRSSHGLIHMKATPKVSLPQVEQLSRGARARLEELWRMHVLPATGMSSYEEMCEALRC